MKMIPATFLARLRKVACALCNTDGGISLGGRKLHMQLTKELKDEYGEFPLDQIKNAVRAMRDLTVVRDIFVNDEDKLSKLVYFATGKKQSKISSTFMVSQETEDIILKHLHRHEFNAAKAMGGILSELSEQIGEITIGDTVIDENAIEFATMFAYNRMWKSLKVPSPSSQKVLKAACNAYLDMTKSAPGDASYRDLENFLATNGIARKSASSMSAQTSLSTNLSNECCKVFFIYGVILNPNFVSWIEDAIAAAYSWSRNQPTLTIEAKDMLDNLFQLSCADRMELNDLNAVLDIFERAITIFNKAMIPPGMGLLWVFHEEGSRPDEALFRMLRRINGISRRRKEK